MVARIYRPARTAMQSGKGRTREWLFLYEPEDPKTVEPLMGYTSSRDMRSQVRLSFATKELAIEYAERNGIPGRGTAHRRTTEGVLFRQLPLRPRTALDALTAGSRTAP
jgi:hypothetical protein